MCAFFHVHIDAKRSRTHLFLSLSAVLEGMHFWHTRASQLCPNPFSLSNKDSQRDHAQPSGYRLTTGVDSCGFTLPLMLDKWLYPFPTYKHVAYWNDLTVFASAAPLLAFSGQGLPLHDVALSHLLMYRCGCVCVRCKYHQPSWQKNNTKHVQGWCLTHMINMIRSW